MTAILNVLAQVPAPIKAAAITLVGWLGNKVVEQVVPANKDKEPKENQDLEKIEVVRANLHEQREISRRLHDEKVANNRQWKIMFAVTVPSVMLLTVAAMRVFTSCDGRGA